MMRGWSALVVDDDEFSRATAVRILRRLNAAAVVEAADGVRAIELAGRALQPFDLILCDLRMPQLDGIETLGRLAAHSRSAMVVLASGADPRLLRAAADSIARAGVAALHVVGKPVTLAKMQEAVMDMLARRSAGPAAERAQAADHGFTVADIRRGLAGREFIAHFQPKITVADRRLCGAEALIRWQHPEFGLLWPGAFMAVAQRSGLLADVFFVALPAAVASCQRWRGQGYRGGISINLPVAVLGTPDLPHRIETAVAGAGLDPEHVTFEVTEDGWLHGQDEARDVLTRLRVRGFGLAIDDFGTGYSGLQQLLHAPFNELKIDGAFVRAAPADREAAIALQSAVALARQLGLQIVAEGVESAAEWDLVAAAGCDEVQGFMISRPLACEQFQAWAQRHHAGWSAAGSTTPHPASAPA